MPNETILNGEFYFNVMLHVFILFTILHLFFKFYISNIITEALSGEFKHIIHNAFENIDKEKLKNNINEYKNSLDELNNLLKTKNISIVSFLKNIYNINNIDDLVNVISTQPNKKNKDIIIDTNKVDEMSTLFAENFSLKYYNKIFKKEDIYRQKINKLVYKNMIFINVLLFVLLILFTSIMYKSELLTITDMKHVVFENCITFFFIGIIEVLFFVNIAFNFIPAPPSAIFISLLSNLKNKFI